MLEPRGKERLWFARDGTGYAGTTHRLSQSVAEFMGLWHEFDPRSEIYKRLAQLPLRITSTWGSHPIPMGGAWDLVLSGENAVVTCEEDILHWSYAERRGTARWYVGTPWVDSPIAFHLPLFYDSWAQRDHQPKGRYRPDSGISFVASNTRSMRRLQVAQGLAKWFPVAVSSGLKEHFRHLPKATVCEVPRTSLGKLEFLAGYPFNLCFENSVAPGYLTEKPFDAVMAGAVPIYEGDPNVADWFDSQGMIECSGLDVEAIADRIRDAEREGLPEFVSERREKLILVGLQEMVGRFEAFLEKIPPRIRTQPDIERNARH